MLCMMAGGCGHTAGGGSPRTSARRGSHAAVLEPDGAVAGRLVLSARWRPCGSRPARARSRRRSMRWRASCGAGRLAPRLDARTVTRALSETDRLGLGVTVPGDRDWPIALNDVRLLLSEMAPGSTATQWRFLARNRILGALSGATVVVEAGHGLPQRRRPRRRARPPGRRGARPGDERGELRHTPAVREGVASPDAADVTALVGSAVEGKRPFACEGPEDTSRPVRSPGTSGTPGTTRPVGVRTALPRARQLIGKSDPGRHTVFIVNRRPRATDRLVMHGRVRCERFLRAPCRCDPRRRGDRTRRPILPESACTRTRYPPRA